MRDTIDVRVGSLTAFNGSAKLMVLCAAIMLLGSRSCEWQDAAVRCAGMREITSVPAMIT